MIWYEIWMLIEGQSSWCSYFYLFRQNNHCGVHQPAYRHQWPRHRKKRMENNQHEDYEWEKEDYNQRLSSVGATDDLNLSQTQAILLRIQEIWTISVCKLLTLEQNPTSTVWQNIISYELVTLFPQTNVSDVCFSLGGLTSATCDACHFWHFYW